MLTPPIPDAMILHNGELTWFYRVDLKNYQYAGYLLPSAVIRFLEQLRAKYKAFSAPLFSRDFASEWQTSGGILKWPNVTCVVAYPARDPEDLELEIDILITYLEELRDHST